MKDLTKKSSLLEMILLYFQTGISVYQNYDKYLQI